MYCEETDCIFRKVDGVCRIPEENNLFVNSAEHGFCCINHITELKDASPEAIKKYLSQNGVMFVHKNTSCVYCEYRKEKYKVKPKECYECAKEKYRDDPYYSFSPTKETE